MVNEKYLTSWSVLIGEGIAWRFSFELYSVGTFNRFNSGISFLRFLFSFGDSTNFGLFWAFESSVISFIWWPLNSSLFVNNMNWFKIVFNHWISMIISVWTFLEVCWMAVLKQLFDHWLESKVNLKDSSQIHEFVDHRKLKSQVFQHQYLFRPLTMSLKMACSVLLAWHLAWH